MKRSTKGAGIVVGVAAFVMATSGAAFAYWTAQASGAGAAGAGSTVQWKVSTDAATGPALAPGGDAQSVVVRIANAGTGVQRVSKVTAVVAQSDGSAWTPAGCSAADFSVAVDPLSADVAPGASTSTTARISMVNRDANQDGCKSVSVPLYVTVS